MGVQTDFVVILSAISPGWFCGTAAQGGGELLPLGAHARPKLSWSWRGGGIHKNYQIAAASVNRGARI